MSPHSVRMSVRWAAAAATALLIPTVVVATAGSAEAAKGGPKSSASGPSLMLDQQAPALGSTVTFTVTYGSAHLRNPSLDLGCYQNDVIVWGGIWDVASSVKLGGDASPWKSAGGSATCVAQLVDVTWQGGQESITTSATTGFVAGG